MLSCSGAFCVLSRSYAAGEYLVRERLLLLPEVDAHFAAAITTNQAGGATELAVHLLKAAAQDPQPPLTGLDLSATSEACLGSPYHPALQQLLSDPRRACVVPSCTAAVVLNCDTISSAQHSRTTCRDLRLQSRTGSSHPLACSAGVQVLAKLAQHTSGGAPLLALLEAARAVAPPAQTDQPQPPQRMDVPRSAPTPASDPNEPAGLREQVGLPLLPQHSANRFLHLVAANHAFLLQPAMP